MPVDLPEREIVIEDTSGSKIRISEINSYKMQFTVSGYPLEARPNPNTRLRKINAKTIVWFNDYLQIRDRLLETIESEEFQDIDAEFLHNLRLHNYTAQPIWVGCFNEQAYIGVFNTVGRRLVVIDDMKRVLEELAQAFIEIEDWYSDFFEDARLLRVSE